MIGAHDGDRAVENDVLVVGAGGEHDGVAGDRGVDRRLDGGIAAIADQQDVEVPAPCDLLDAGEGVGALGPARGHGEVAGADRATIAEVMVAGVIAHGVSLPRPPISVSAPPPP